MAPTESFFGSSGIALNRMRKAVFEDLRDLRGVIPHGTGWEDLINHFEELAVKPLDIKAPWSGLLGFPIDKIEGVVVPEVTGTGCSWYREVERAIEQCGREKLVWRTKEIPTRFLRAFGVAEVDTERDEKGKVGVLSIRFDSYRIGLGEGYFCTHRKGYRPFDKDTAAAVVMVGREYWIRLAEEMVDEERKDNPSFVLRAGDRQWLLEGVKRQWVTIEEISLDQARKHSQDSRLFVVEFKDVAIPDFS